MNAGSGTDSTGQFIAIDGSDGETLRATLLVDVDLATETNVARELFDLLTEVPRNGTLLLNARHSFIDVRGLTVIESVAKAAREEGLRCVLDEPSWALRFMRTLFGLENTIEISDSTKESGNGDGA